MACGAYTKAIAKISKIRKNRTLNPTFSTPESPQHSADTMASHLESIFSGDLLHDLPRLAIFPPIVPFGGDSPFDTTFIQDTINHMPTKKAPGIDHLRSEMLKPIQHLLAPLLLELFRRCWRWSYTPHTWRIAQVVPIYKKASPTDASNYRPISLQSYVEFWNGVSNQVCSLLAHPWT